MALKTNGKELKTFFAHPAYWPTPTGPADEQVRLDTVQLSINGKLIVNGKLDDPGAYLSTVEDSAKIVLGQVYCPRGTPTAGTSLADYFWRWLKETDHLVSGQPA